MSRFVLLVAVALLLSTAAAEAQPIVNVRGHGAASWFRSPTEQRSLVDSGFELGLGVGVEVLRGLEVTLEGTFDRFPGNENQLVLNLANLFPNPRIRPDGGDVQAWSAALGMRYTYVNDTPAQPYVAASGSYSAYSAQQADVFVDDALFRRAPRAEAMAFGYQVAVGVSFRINDRYAFFVEPRYVVAYTSDQRVVFDFQDGRQAVQLVTGRDEPIKFVPVRLGLQFRPWGTRPLDD